MIMNALGRLTQASGRPTIRIEEMTHYHAAFELTCRLGWFIDAVQLVERLRVGMTKETAE